MAFAMTNVLKLSVSVTRVVKQFGARRRDLEGFLRWDLEGVQVMRCHDDQKCTVNNFCSGQCSGGYVSLDTQKVSLAGEVEERAGIKKPSGTDGRGYLVDEHFTWASFI